jgi:hypothetical protein
LASKHETLSSNPSTTKRDRVEGREGRKEGKERRTKRRKKGGRKEGKKK